MPPMFCSKRLPALAAYEFLMQPDGTLLKGTVNEPFSFNAPWVSSLDRIVVSYLWQVIRHSDPEDTWGFVFSARELSEEINAPLSSTKRTLHRLEKSGVLIRKDDVRVLFAHPYTIALACLDEPLPVTSRASIVKALEIENSFRPVHRVLRERNFVFAASKETLKPNIPALEKASMTLITRLISCGNTLKDGSLVSPESSYVSQNRLICEPTVNNSNLREPASIKGGGDVL